ncbi:MAG: cytochrome c maturation protein CcmE [Hyphomonadaceae bacterium]|nr:cytochrome c maturation protein CcmE [Hyphomonadaceae bacterium]
MRRSRQRMIVIGAAGVLLSGAVALALLGAQDSVAYFYAPSDLAAKAKAGERVRIGGMVAPGSIAKDPASETVLFKVSDGAGVVQVRYEGIPPDLFAENQGVVAEGVWRGGEVFEADRILAKHDETYMPREVVDALKDKGEWRGDP